ncbi:MAG: bis(5'-nucleosyl)-tetraphosphatase (symmetrical) YqeK [Oscillospiraceae bacterium]|nr:bis(5'-nucleosyl)-tetraphosphatase (symmetrical) YqeK [Oscillospiraceae bacterium]
MRIGIYGGTFNPPHLGHMAAARAAFGLLRLDKLLIIPAGIPPHKNLVAGGGAEAFHRLGMTRLAAEQLGLGDKAEVCDIEISRGGKSYTADTVEAIKARYPEDDLWLLMGTDMFLTLHMWYAPERIFANATIAAFGRNKGDGEDVFAAQRRLIKKKYPNAEMLTFMVPGVIDVSSTRLRADLADGRGGEFLAPPVLGYIMREGLYGTHTDLKSLEPDALRPIAMSYLKYKRMAHVLGTEQEAIRLAEKYGADVRKAQIAALLHDCTKKLEMEQQKALCAKYGLKLDPLENKALKLLHSKTGAEIARDVFGVDDEIYGAIKWHTTGKADMTMLEKVIYLADYIEPNRDFPGVDKLREAVYEDIDKGLLMGLEMTINEMEERGNEVHEKTLQARDFLKG